MVKRLVVIGATALLLLSLLTGCSRPQTVNSAQLQVVTTLFPQYDFVRQVAGDRAEVKLLLPAGVETHVYEPTPDDIIAIKNADLFIYTGENMEPWAAQIIAGLGEAKTAVVDSSTGITLLRPDEDEHEHEHESEAEEHEHEHLFDPHIWLDPNLAQVMVDNITAALCQADPDGQVTYRQNAADYRQQLTDLDQELRAAVEAGQRREIVFGGRFAFRYLTTRYGLDWTAAYDTCSTEGEPSAQTIAALVREIEQEQIPVIYHEELVDPLVAKSISQQTGAKLVLLHSCHNVTADELNSGVTYLELMRQNVQALAEGLR